MPAELPKGLAVIHAALETALRDRGVAGAAVECVPPRTQADPACFTVTVKGVAQSAEFTPQEITDSGEAIDAPAAVKVRMLVSHFVR